MKPARGLGLLFGLYSLVTACGGGPTHPLDDGGDTQPADYDDGDPGPGDFDEGDYDPGDPVDPGDDDGDFDDGDFDDGDYDPGDPVDPGDGDDLPADVTAPTAGEGPIFVTVESAFVTVAWTAATDDVTPEAELYYRVVRAAAPETIDSVEEADEAYGYDVVLDWTPGALHADALDLLSGAEYAFAVLVSDAAGNLALYPPASVRLQDVWAPQAPGLTFVGVGADSAWLTWMPGRDTLGGPLEYKLVRGSSYEAIDSPEEVAVVTAPDLLLDWQTASYYLLAGLTPETTYYLALQARDAAGNTSWVYPQLLDTADMVPPVPGTPIIVEDVTASMARVSWGAASDPGYVVYRLALSTEHDRVDTLLEVSTYPTAWVQQGGTGTYLTGLLPATRYWFAVMASDVYANASLYEPATFHTPDPTPPAAGTGISFPEHAGDWVRIEWGAAIDAETPPEKLEYRVVWSFVAPYIDEASEVRDYADNDWGGLVLEWTPGVTSTTLGGLIPGQTYWVAVLVRDLGAYPELPEVIRGEALYAPASFLAP